MRFSFGKIELLQRLPNVVFQESGLQQFFENLLIDQFIQISLNNVWTIKLWNKNFYMASLSSASADDNIQAKLHARAHPILLRDV